MATVAKPASEFKAVNLIVRLLSLIALLVLVYFSVIDPPFSMSALSVIYTLGVGGMVIFELGQALLLRGFNREVLFDDLQAMGWYLAGLVNIFHLIDPNSLSYSAASGAFIGAGCNHLIWFIFEHNKSRVELIFLVLILLLDKFAPIGVKPTGVNHAWQIYNTQASVIAMLFASLYMGSYSGIVERFAERKVTIPGRDKAKSSKPKAKDKPATPSTPPASKPTVQTQPPAQKAPASQQKNGPNTQKPANSQGYDLISQIRSGNQEVIKKTFALLKQLEDRVAEFMTASGMPEHVQNKLLKSPEAMVEVVSHPGFERAKNGNPSQKDCFLRLLKEGLSTQQAASPSDGNSDSAHSSAPSEESTIDELVAQVVEKQTGYALAAKKIQSTLTKYEPRSELENFLQKSALPQPIIDILIAGTAMQLINLLDDDHELGDIVTVILKEIEKTKT